MLAGRLIEKKISAKAYHAGLKNTERDSVQEDWMEVLLLLVLLEYLMILVIFIKGRVKIIVATISFGMVFSLYHAELKQLL